MVRQLDANSLVVSGIFFFRLQRDQSCVRQRIQRAVLILFWNYRGIGS